MSNKTLAELLILFDRIETEISFVEFSLLNNPVESKIFERNQRLNALLAEKFDLAHAIKSKIDELNEKVFK